MGFDFSGLNNAVINTFADNGESSSEERIVIFKTSIGTHSVEAIFMAPYDSYAHLTPSGKFQVRIPPEQHRNLAIKAAEAYVNK